MKTKYRSPETKLFTYRIATLVTLILLVAAGGGLGLLWLRQEISASAARTRATERQLAEVGRRLQYVNVKIAEATTPEALKQRASQLALGLVPPSNSQLVRTSAPRRTLETTDTAVASVTAEEPLYATFELALIKSPSRTN